MVVGLVVGVLGIQSSLKVSASIALFAPLVILTIPFPGHSGGFATPAAYRPKHLCNRPWPSASLPVGQGLVNPPQLLDWFPLFSVLAAMGGLISLGMGRELDCPMHPCVTYGDLDHDPALRLRGVFARQETPGSRFFLLSFRSARSASLTRSRCICTEPWVGRI